MGAKEVAKKEIKRWTCMKSRRGRTEKNWEKGKSCTRCKGKRRRGIWEEQG